MGTSELLGKLNKCRGVTWLASRPGDVEIHVHVLPATSCYRNRDKLRQLWASLGSTTSLSKNFWPVWLWLPPFGSCLLPSSLQIDLVRITFLLEVFRSPVRSERYKTYTIRLHTSIPVDKLRSFHSMGRSLQVSAPTTLPSRRIRYLGKPSLAWQWMKERGII